jgi:hypothetical protein
LPFLAGGGVGYIVDISLIVAVVALPSPLRAVATEVNLSPYPGEYSSKLLSSSCLVFLLSDCIEDLLKSSPISICSNVLPSVSLNSWRTVAVEAFSQFKI